MVGFKEFLLNESYKNLTSREEKEKYAEEVFSLLQSTYSKIGGEMVEKVMFGELGKGIPKN